ncbi:MAG TPA: rod shape-determining protein RodA [Gammaproteobacteria bacterium]|nr:rod shape-determining protein RodA [Gammaproteobacteria bacterium]
MKKSILGFLGMVFIASTGAVAEPALYFIEPQPGAVVSSPVTVKFGLRGFGVAPAGVQKEKTGHHHLLIDTGLPPLDQPVPTDEHHRHFGGGQTETSIELPSGEHTLQLLLGDFSHIPHNPPLISEQITITVN